MEFFKNRLRVLYDHSIGLSQAESVDEVLEITYNALSSALEGNRYDIALLVDGVLRDTHYSDGSMFSIPIRESSITTRAAREKRSQLVNDTRLDPDYILGVSPIRALSELVVPIVVNDDTFGVINVESFQLNAFVEDDKEILETFAINIANAIERIKRVEILERNVRERTLELEESNKALQELDEMKNQFLSIAAHELKTPLSSIIGYNELIESLAEQLSQEALLYLDIIKRNTDRLETIVDDLLMQQRLMRGTIGLKLSQVDPRILLRTIIQENDPIVSKKKQKLLLDLGINIPSVSLDEIRISQVLTNLIHNASKFSPEDADIEVSLKTVEDNVVFSVRDYGIGLSEKNLGKLFEPFPDIPGRNQYGGTGLGLSICKGFIDLHNGEIWAESDGPGKGTRVSFSLPITRTKTP